MIIRFFGIAKDIVGSSQLEFKAFSSSLKNVGDLKVHLCKKYPELKKLSSMAIALNKKYATEDMAISVNDEIAIIPPVSGG
jgi:molybdopterin converting factor subunit 1|tara:strand:+ start:203 stop:445 length:243 start_codon:yes stop_codon:yes gene_type:complete